MAFVMRSQSNPKRYHMGIWKPADGMGSLFGDIKTAAVKAVGEGITKAKVDLTKTVQKEAAKGATKLVTKLIAPKTTVPTVTVTTQAPQSPAPVAGVISTAQLPADQRTVVYTPADSIIKYAPYAVAMVGGLALVVMLAKRK